MLATSPASPASLGPGCLLDLIWYQSRVARGWSLVYEFHVLAERAGLEFVWGSFRLSKGLMWLRQFWANFGGLGQRPNQNQ